MKDSRGRTIAAGDPRLTPQQVPPAGLSAVTLAAAASPPAPAAASAVSSRRSALSMVGPPPGVLQGRPPAPATRPEPRTVASRLVALVGALALFWAVILWLGSMAPTDYHKQISPSSLPASTCRQFGYGSNRPVSAWIVNSSGPATIVDGKCANGEDFETSLP